MYKGKKFPKDIIDDWPEVFEDITCKVIPLEYLDSVIIKFKNEKVWEIKVSSQSKQDWDLFEGSLREILIAYKDELEFVDFKIDTNKIKKDVIRGTKQFLRKRKLK